MIIRKLRFDYQAVLGKDEAAAISHTALRMLAQRLTQESRWTGQLDNISIPTVKIPEPARDRRGAAGRIAGAIYQGITGACTRRSDG